MKKIMVMLLGICIAPSVSGQALERIKLNPPDTHRGESTMQAFVNRKSTREFSERPLSHQDLSDLLWAAIGINRPSDGKRTSPTAMNRQEIDLYVCMPEGAYLYDAQAHELKLVSGEDLRPLVAGQQAFVRTAPVCLLITGPVSESRDNIMIAADAGIVSQSISLFCSGCGFATVPRGSMDRDALHTGLGLGKDRMLYLNHPVGYFK